MENQYSFNWEETKSNWYIDQEHKLMLFKNPGWNPDGENGKGDAIGRSADAYYIYGDPRFIEGIENCWVKERRKTWIGRVVKGTYYNQGYRYPTYASGEEEQPVGISRDHVLETVIAYKIAGKSNKEMWELVKGIRFRLSDFALQTPDMWLWMRVISGRWIWVPLYYPIELLTQTFGTWFQKIVQKIIKFGPDYELHQDEFKHMQNEDKPACVQRQRMLLYPTYAMLITSWRYKLLPDSWFKRKLQKSMLKICPKYNYLIKLLLSNRASVTQADVDGYKSMRGGRWSGNLNKWWNNRGLYIIPEGHEWLCANIMDEDYLKRAWDDETNK